MPSRQKYNQARREIAPHVLAPVKIDAQTRAFFDEAKSTWVERSCDLNSPYSEALKTLGMKPNVSNMVHVLTYRLPEYSLLSRERTRKSVRIGLVQSVVLPVSVDKSIHVSDDNNVAIIKITPSLIYTFADEDDALRHTEYQKTLNK